MRLSSDKVLNYVSQKASDGDERAKIAYEYLKPLFDQWEKLEKINHKLDYIERCKKNIREIELSRNNGRFSECDERMLRYYKNALDYTENERKQLIAEYDAEYSA